MRHDEAEVRKAELQRHRKQSKIWHKIEMFGEETAMATENFGSNKWSSDRVRDFYQRS